MAATMTMSHCVAVNFLAEEFMARMYDGGKGHRQVFYTHTDEFSGGSNQ
jgi:hypothetical protein